MSTASEDLSLVVLAIMGASLAIGNEALALDDVAAHIELPLRRMKAAVALGERRGFLRYHHRRGFEVTTAGVAWVNTLARFDAGVNP